MYYKLEVVQQPIRARMCGFGSKDRRPCTPTPIVKLRAFDEDHTEINPQEIGATFFTAMAQLWTEDKSTEVNLVRHKSIATDVSYSVDHDYTSNGYSIETCLSDRYSTEMVSPQKDLFGRNQSTDNRKQEMIKNLVGNTVTTSLNLHDLDGNVGIYFIFNDLSIRKDGIFRLKFLFFDLGREGRINSSFTEVRAEVFSEPFYVFTARNFPGMIETTPLSLCFSKQGVKIPIRREGGKERD